MIGSPKMPCPFVGDPDAEQKIGNRVGGDGIAEMTAPENEPLVGGAADDAGKPLVPVDDSKHNRGDKKRGPMEGL